MKFIKQTFKSLFDDHSILFCIILSFLMNFIIESSARLSVLGGILCMLKRPWYFIYNSTLLMLTYSIALLFKKRIFTITLINVWWIIACVVNSILIFYRHTPFTAADFLLIKSALNIMHVYISKQQLALLIIAAVLIVFLLTFLFIKEKKKNPDYRKISLLLCVSIILSLLPSGYISAQKDKSPKTNLTDEAYHYGFVCCFLNSIFNNGINKPNKYSQNSIVSIVDNLDNNSDEQITPNIVVVQLESFIDPYLIKSAEYSNDPIPNFRKLKDECSSGKLNVSVYGGGTANTEFEILTGMSLHFFGIGECPYETILHDKTVESICYNLDQLGYTSHALHNHTGTFYDRYLVYKNLGFDTFTPIEHMNNVKLNKLGWAKSDVFTKYILDSMKSTKEQDFVFTVTVQGHGKYPDNKVKDAEYELINGSEPVMNIKNQLDFYINELHEEDIWLGELVETLSEYDEPVMLIVYGDHMPSLNSPEDFLDSDDIYSTEYAIWTNYESKIDDKDLKSYNLLSYALSHLNVNNGIITKLHQNGLTSDNDYSEQLHKIQYDMIYGEKFVYGEDETSPHMPTDMKLGIYDIVIDDIRISSEKAQIIGKNFTPYSVVFVDGDELDTKFVDGNTLEVSSKKCKNFNEITVRQIASDSTILGTSEPFINQNELEG